MLKAIGWKGKSSLEKSEALDVRRHDPKQRKFLSIPF